MGQGICRYMYESVRGWGGIFVDMRCRRKVISAAEDQQCLGNLRGGRSRFKQRVVGLIMHCQGCIEVNTLKLI